mmetsp:Transcript_42725/g.65602  ORF Transcript_42725/g.65602 Transcript_42725/m.65602 type:complete len:431 (+) Transcript_42725:113-1405(+)
MLGRSLYFLCLVQPAQVVSLHVVPSIFKFVSGGPKELSGGVLIEVLKSALSDGLNLGLLEILRVGGALALLDASHLLVEGTEGSEDLSFSIKVMFKIIWQISIGAVHPLAVSLGSDMAIVEASEPHAAVVSGKGPLAHPDGVVELISGLGEVGVSFAILIGCVQLELAGVEMSVKGHIVGSWVEQSVPELGIEHVRVMENEGRLRGVLLGQLLGTLVELFEHSHVGVRPGLVERLEPSEVCVGSELLEESLRHSQLPLQVVVVDVGVAIGGHVPLTHPLASLYRPVLEVGAVDPVQLVGLAAVVKAILRVLGSVDVKEELDALMSELLQDFVDLVEGAVVATDVGAVRFHNPVANWYSDNLHLSVLELLDDIVINPAIPMGFHESISVLGAESLADGVGIEANLRLGVVFSQELVEKRRSNPWFKDHPSS